MFKSSPEIERLTEWLRPLQKATYSQISAFVGSDIQKAKRYMLSIARDRLEKDGIFFLVDRNIGIVRASNTNLVHLSTTQPIAKVRRIVSKSKKREVFVNTQELTPEVRLTFAIGNTCLTFAGKMTSRGMRTQIAKELEKSDGEVITLQQLVTLPRLRKKEA